MVRLFPVIKLSDSNMLDLLKVLPLNCIVLRLQDLVASKTYDTNSTFRKIKKARGAHNFLGFRGKIILSLVMKDEIISKFNPEKYAEIIHTLKPDFYTTVDGETYEGEEELSLREINRCFNETAELMKLCPLSKPVGHVKGSNELQVLYHVNLLKSLGINDFILHIGDFFRNGDPGMILRAKKYALIIKKQARNLFLYGMGSQKRLIEFSFADGYITFNHFVTAFNGKKYIGINKIGYSGGYSSKIVKDNLIEIINNIKRIENQKKLIQGGVCPWEAEEEDVDQAM